MVTLVGSVPLITDPSPLYFFSHLVCGDSGETVFIVMWICRTKLCVCTHTCSHMLDQLLYCCKLVESLRDRVVSYLLGMFNMLLFVLFNTCRGHRLCYLNSFPCGVNNITLQISAMPTNTDAVGRTQSMMVFLEVVVSLDRQDMPVSWHQRIMVLLIR